MTTELTEGPYYFDAGAIRRDIREDRGGQAAPWSYASGRQRLHADLQCGRRRLALRRPGALFGLRGCVAVGGDGSRSDDERYLRGAQVTNDDGVVEFETIYPGWYQGRTPHIHAKVHLDKRTQLTTQLFFDEQLVTGVDRDKRYSRDSKREVTNSSDSIFDESLVLTLRRQGAGWVGAMTVDVERA